MAYNISLKYNIYMLKAIDYNVGIGYTDLWLDFFDEIVVFQFDLTRFAKGVHRRTNDKLKTLSISAIFLVPKIKITIIVFTVEMTFASTVSNKSIVQGLSQALALLSSISNIFTC